MEDIRHMAIDQNSNMSRYTKHLTAAASSDVSLLMKLTIEHMHLQDRSSSGTGDASIDLDNTQDAEPTMQPALRMIPRPLQYRY